MHVCVYIYNIFIDSEFECRLVVIKMSLDIDSYKGIKLYIIIYNFL